jgi:hypothetical protein
MMRRSEFRFGDVEQLQDISASNGSGEDGFHLKLS